MEIVRLIICDRDTALEVGREVLEQTNEVEDETERLDLLNLITTVLSYKFADLSREAMEQMFGLDEYCGNKKTISLHLIIPILI